MSIPLPKSIYMPQFGSIYNSSIFYRHINVIPNDYQQERIKRLVPSEVT